MGEREIRVSWGNQRSQRPSLSAYLVSLVVKHKYVLKDQCLWVCGCGCVFAQSQHHCWAFMLIETQARLCLLQRDPCSQPRIMSISVIFIYKNPLQSKHSLKPQTTRATDPYYKLRYSFMTNITLTCLVHKIVLRCICFHSASKTFLWYWCPLSKITHLLNPSVHFSISCISFAL